MWFTGMVPNANLSSRYGIQMVQMAHAALRTAYRYAPLL